MSSNFQKYFQKLLQDPFEFPSHYGFAKESGNADANYPSVSGFSNSNWDNFFTGHADNIEKDIHTLSRQPDDHTAPPDDYEQSEEQEQHGEHGEHQTDGGGRDYDHGTSDYGVSFFN